VTVSNYFIRGAAERHKTTCECPLSPFGIETFEKPIPENNARKKLPAKRYQVAQRGILPQPNRSEFVIRIWSFVQS
jgi:hypothetical protein